MPELLTVSLSQVGMYLTCEQKYYLAYIEGLQKIEHDVPPERGIIFHDAYLETYYRLIQAHRDPDEAHEIAMQEVEKQRERCEGYATLARLGESEGAEQVAAEFAELPDVISRIADRYYYTHGKADAARYEPLIIEQFINSSIAPQINTLGRIDMVTRDLWTGRISIWEHKTTLNVPGDGILLRDLQTLLYAGQLRTQPDGSVGTDGDPDSAALDVDSIIWNHIRTKEPAEPKILKSGKISTAKNQDTTWDVYAEAVIRAGGDPEHTMYDEMYEQLLDREDTVFFPRREKVIVMDEDIVLRDYIATARVMRQKRADWARGVSKPIRTGMLSNGRNCEWCPYNKLCFAELTGGDVESVLNLKFRRKARTHR